MQINKPEILVSGFLPFQGEQLNPSELLLHWIQEKYLNKIDTILLPVSFEKAHIILQSKLRGKNYKVLLMLGQAGGRSRICLERVALNWIETDFPDEDRVSPARGPIEIEGPAALFTDLPIEGWKSRLAETQQQVEISLSAGGYVCNQLYYKSLQWIKGNNVRTGACFIHVPYLPEQTSNKSQAPSMELEEMQKILEKIFSFISEDIKGAQQR
jgi:pyroglutamyl-peptidase